MPDEDPTDPRIQIDDHTIVAGHELVSDIEGPHRASLIVIAGWEIGREFELSEEEHVFGRSLLVSNRIGSPSVSREHAKIVSVRNGDQEHFEIFDLGSSNGTRLNNTRVTQARLGNGDKIQMGDVLFKFVLQDTADARFHRDVHRLIHYDQLTGLLTMEAFRRMLDTEMRKTGPLTIAMTDLDGLKRVNDTYGHLAGRMVVREMGVIIREAIRPGDRAALYGGDEAIILFAGAVLDEAAPFAEGLRESIESRVFEHCGTEFQVTISQGLAECPRHGHTIEQLIAAADQALYAAKADGRNCVRYAGE